MGEVKQDINLGGYLRYMIMSLNGKIALTENSSVREFENQMSYSTQMALTSEFNDGLLRNVFVIRRVRRLLKYPRMH